MLNLCRLSQLGLIFELSGGETKVLSVMITADDAGFHLHTTNDSNLTTTASKISHHALGQNNFRIYIYIYLSISLVVSIYCSVSLSIVRSVIHFIVQSFFLSLGLSLVVGYSIICFITLSIS